MDPSTSFSKLSLTVDEGDYDSVRFSKQSKGKAKTKAKGKNHERPAQSTKLRGRDHDSSDVRLSKTVTWLLRHAADSEGIEMRADGYVKVSQMLDHMKLKDSGLNLEKLQVLVRSNDKQRYDLILEGPDGEILETVDPRTVVSAADVAEQAGNLQSQASKKGVWLIRARQGHSMKNIRLEMKPILSLNDIPTKIAVHGTNREAWKSICSGGLSKMNRNHIHIAQDVGGDNVISGMRLNSQILIYIDVEKAINAGLKFWFSENGVILSEGDENGYISRGFFLKVVDTKLGELHGWEQ